MANFSKLIGSIVGALLGVGVSKYGLPPELASPEVVGAIVGVIAALGTYIAPANQKV